MNDARERYPKPGEFPFRLLDGPKESPYLVWLRNHSNYMAARGWLDYLRATGVLVRGIWANSLYLLSYLVVIAIAVAAYSEPDWRQPMAGGLMTLAAALLAWPLAARWEKSVLRLLRAHRSRVGRWVVRVFAVAVFLIVTYLAAIPLAAIVLLIFDEARFPLTWTVLSLWVAWSLAFVLSTPLFRIFTFVRTLKTGSDSSVGSRDAYERSFGGFLLAFLAVAAFEVLAQSLRPFHDAVRTLGWPTVSSLAAVSVGILSVSEKLVAALPKGARHLALSLVGLLGLLVPLGVVLALADVLLYRPPFIDALELWTAIAVVASVIAVATLYILIFGFRALSPRDFLFAGGLVVLMFYTTGWALISRDEDVTVVDRVDWRYRDAEDSVEVRLRGSSDLSTVLESLARAEAVDPAPGMVRELEAFLGPEPSPGSDTAQAVRRVFDCGGAIWLRCTPEKAWSHVARHAIFSAPSDDYEDELRAAVADARGAAVVQKAAFLLAIAGLLGFVSWLTVDVNLTSIHGLYRDRLASAFLIIGTDTGEEIHVEEDVNLAELCRHEAGSTAPYHLLNVALNLQASRDMTVRDRKSDFFIFSKRFVGGDRTRYCRSESMEQLFPQMDLATAMAISAGAASPNMGRATHPALRAIMTLLNIRLGFWLPNPRRVEDYIDKKTKGPAGQRGGFGFDEVFGAELGEVSRRWANLDTQAGRKLAPPLSSPPAGEPSTGTPTVEHGLVGLAFSGGGIRSATLNLGITQALHRRGVFDHVDYMSTVSGGGYLGSSISTAMRQKVRISSEVAGWASVDEEAKTVRVTGRRGRPLAGPDGEPREYVYAYHPDAELAVADGKRVIPGQRLIHLDARPDERETSAGRIFGWRVRPGALLREVAGRLNEESRWVNVSDGGHIENLAVIELLRRRCKYILVGDGEADPGHHFQGLATLIRTARIDLGTRIEIDVGALRVDDEGVSRAHWAIGTVHYPAVPGGPAGEVGYLLYMKSSVTGTEDEVIRQYRQSSEGRFPHESTADQSFTEGQFEAYRSLGQRIGESVLKHALGEGDSLLEHALEEEGAIPYASLDDWMEGLKAAQAKLLAGIEVDEAAVSPA